MPKPKLRLPSAVDQLLLDAAVEINQNPDATETAFMARQLVQCTLPHSDPGDTPMWTRTNGNLTLVIQLHIDRQTRKAMYPYGSIPRLFLFWLVTEASERRAVIFDWAIASTLHARDGAESQDREEGSAVTSSASRSKCGG